MNISHFRLVPSHQLVICAAKNALELTEAGQYLCVLLMREFFIGVNNFRDQMRRNIPRERELAGLQDRTELND